MAAVGGKRREEWLELFADDCRVEDPVGHLPGIAGRAALAQFWDQGIAPLDSVEFEVSRQWEAGAEAMLLATVSVVGPNGVGVSYDGTFNYALDESRPDRLVAGLLGSARGRRGLLGLALRGRLGGDALAQGMVDDAGAAAALGDRGDDERGADAGVAGGEDAVDGGREACRP